MVKFLKLQNGYYSCYLIPITQIKEIKIMDDEIYIITDEHSFSIDREHYSDNSFERMFEDFLESDNVFLHLDIR